jgi:hypothetical protein
MSNFMFKRLATLCCFGFSSVCAQEPTFMEAGTHPGFETLYQRLIWTSPTLRAGEAAEQRWDLKTAYGIQSHLAIEPDIGFDGDGWRYASLRLKQRVIQRDTGPIDTWRASVHGGVEWFDGRDPGPRFGVVSTTIRGRHGWNGQAEWHGGMSKQDRFELNASYLYRLAPDVYQPGTRGAWYTMLESLNQLGGDGEHRGDLASGLLYEARRWAAEISLRFVEPDQDVRFRSTRIGLGYRRLW